MKKRIGMPFCTNVLRVALNFREEKIASTLITYYKTSLDTMMIIRAIKTNQLVFLYCLFAFNKNFTRLNNYIGEEYESTETQSDEEEGELNRKIRGLNYTAFSKARNAKYKTLTFDFLFKKVLEYDTDGFEPKISAIADWGL